MCNLVSHVFSLVMLGLAFEAIFLKNWAGSFCLLADSGVVFVG